MEVLDLTGQSAAFFYDRITLKQVVKKVNAECRARFIWLCFMNVLPPLRVILSRLPAQTAGLAEPCFFKSERIGQNFFQDNLYKSSQKIVCNSRFIGLRFGFPVASRVKRREVLLFYVNDQKFVGGVSI